MLALGATTELERIRMDESSEQVRTAVGRQPMRPMPLVVLTRSNPAGAEDVLPPGLSAAALDGVWFQLQRHLFQLVPGARQIATNSGHYIQLDRPQLVIGATRAVVDAVRNGETQLGPGELADTGSGSWVLVAIASTLTALGLALRAVAHLRNVKGRRRTS